MVFYFMLGPGKSEQKSLLFQNGIQENSNFYEHSHLTSENYLLCFEYRMTFISICFSAS